MADVQPSIRLDLSGGDRIGAGKIALLQAVHAKRTISAAARYLGMAYRRAWVFVEELNDALRDPP